jgi:hypothetical protein
MARIAGIQVNKGANGKPKSITIDLKKHGDKFRQQLIELGLGEVIDEDYDPEFEKEWAKGGMTPEELRQHLYRTIDSLPWDK